jgi:hypothetical protein
VQSPESLAQTFDVLWPTRIRPCPGSCARKKPGGNDTVVAGQPDGMWRDTRRSGCIENLKLGSRALAGAMLTGQAHGSIDIARDDAVRSPEQPATERLHVQIFDAESRFEARADAIVHADSARQSIHQRRIPITISTR